MKLPRLNDGTAYHGRLGEIAYDRDEDKVQCHLCGDWFRTVGGTHLRVRHGWTPAEYRDAFRLPIRMPSCAPSVSQTLRTYAAQRIAEGGESFGKGVEPVRRRGVRQPRPWRTIGTMHPDLVAEWDTERNSGLDPSALSPSSKRAAWWICSACGHGWRAAVNNRAENGSGCPVCRLKQRADTQSRVSRERSLAVRCPDLLSELHPTRNQGLDVTQIGAGSSRKVWWVCPTCEHEWKAVVANRVRGNGCPPCGVRRRSAARRSTPSAFPDNCVLVDEP
jgi:rubrerythrin